MTSYQRWNLAASILLISGIVLFVVCWMAGLYNGLYVLAVLGVVGFIGITVWKSNE